MSTRFRILLSHLLLVAAGGWLAWQSGDGWSGQPSNATTQGKPAQLSGRGQAGQGFYPTKDWHGSDYARAWKAVRKGQSTTRERIRLQRDLLKSWADVDLAAAIEAALGEAWDRDGEPDLDHCGPLLDVFSEALAKNPQEGWDMIRGRQFGVGTGLLRRVWMEGVGRSNPLFLAQRLGKLSWRDRGPALVICHTALQQRPDRATAEQLFKVVAAFPEALVSAEQLLDFVPVESDPAEDAAELKQDIIRLAPLDERMAKVKAMLLGKQFAAETPDEIAAEAALLPEGV